MCHHKHFSNPQLGCKEMHKNANDKKVAEEAEKKPREKPREL